MENALRIGLIGDYSAQVKAHIAIPKALEFASSASDCRVEPVWLATRELDGVDERQLALFDGLWCVPASPYESMEGALKAIRFARERKVPFLGTCGGFQHALIEYARNVLGLTKADHAETSPDSLTPLISRLSCSLAEAAEAIRLTPGTRLQQIYGATEASERYNCNFGLNPKFENLLRDSEFVISARDPNQEVRAFELAHHPFFVATLFQPERQALNGTLHPLVRAFIDAAQSATSR